MPREATMLFEADRHEALVRAGWDEIWARAAVRALALDIERHRLPAGHWPIHPNDDEGDAPKAGFKSLYLGSAGLLWALWTLQRAGAVEVGLDLRQAIEDADMAYARDPDTGSVVPSYLLGEVGILLVAWRLTGSAAVADRLHAAVSSNIDNPTNESLWAAPGTMVAAWHLWAATGQARWRSLFVANVDRLWATWQYDEAARCHVWTQDMYGRVVQYLGAGHGFAGNAYPLLRGAALLDDERREGLYERCVATLAATAEWDDGAVNWPPGLYTPRPGAARLLMQWCHGAPGFVTALADFPAGRSTELDAMLVAAGHAVWRAGPLTKGYGLCHGTAGNGVAFLTLYRRTGETMWLDRARAFAVHALAQRERMRAQLGQGRFTLWTGDAGLAMFVWQCIGGEAGMPGLDRI
jgi:hypothetical protein